MDIHTEWQKRKNYLVSQEIIEGKSFKMSNMSCNKPEIDCSKERSIFVSNKVKNKIFIGGISNKLSEPALLDYFSRFGKILSLKVFLDPETKKRRGFGFVIFKKKEAYRLVLDQAFHLVEGILVECKKTVPKKKTNAKTKLQPKNRLGSIAEYSPPSILHYFSYKLGMDPEYM